MDGAVVRWRRGVRKRDLVRGSELVAEEEDAAGARPCFLFAQIRGIAVDVECHGAG